MALSNAERQARHHQRRMGKLAICVTADDIIEATKILHRIACEQSQEDQSWAAFIAQCGKRGGREYWRDMVPAGLGEDAFDFVADARERALLEKVAPVAYAVLNPPSLE